MIKLETHCHSLGGSPCGTSSADFIAEKYSDAGYKAIVLTNHLQKPYFDLYEGETNKEKTDFYFSLVDKLQESAKPYGIKVFFGAEVLANSFGAHSEYILCGFDRKFLYDNKPLYECPQEELYNIAKKHDFLMYKTHPFRPRETIGSPLQMNAVEVFNGHYHHENNNEQAEEFADKYNLIKISGTDFHHDDQPITAGIFAPENLTDERAFADYVLSGKAQLIKDDLAYKKAHEIYLKEKNNA